jgi:glycosyltransferase involved in cell wall biosynthesis
MNTTPTLSVIIPTYNRAALLPKTLESVLDQTFTDYEIIVVDDGSTDRTEEAVARLVQARPGPGKRIRYLFQRNQGKSVALNNALSVAKGAWIAFLDSDDLWLPNKLEEQFKALEKHSPQSQACFTDARFINNPYFQGTAFARAGKRFADKTGVLDNPMEVVGRFWVSMVTLLLSARMMAQVGEFDSRFWVGEDDDFIFRLSLHTALCYVNSPLVLIDRTPNRTERLTEIRFRREFEVLKLRQLRFEKWLRLCEGFDGHLQATLRAHLGAVHSEQVNWLLVNRRYGEARHAAALAASNRWRPGIVAKWCLAMVAPALARRLVLQRSRSEKRDLYTALLHADVKDSVPVSLPKGSAWLVAPRHRASAKNRTT